MSNKSTKGYNGTPQAKTRRNTVIKALESQLKSGKKYEKVNGKTTNKKVDLTDSDKERISKELETLKSRL